MDIEYSMLTGKIYARTKKEKVDIIVFCFTDLRLEMVYTQHLYRIEH